MKRIQYQSSLLLTLLLPLFFSSCYYDNIPVLPSKNIILRDQRLAVIEANVQGNWKLVKITGGLCGLCGPRVTNNPYMDITNDHIVLGNDLGVYVDTIIVWKGVSLSGEYTYLLSYRDTNEIVDRIKNDTLILIDDTSDPFYYNYLKTKQP
jgi:hypothetical protein